MQHSKFLLHLLLSAVVIGNTTFANAKSENDIKLVLQITVDGLRGDLINRYELKGSVTNKKRLAL